MILDANVNDEIQPELSTRIAVVGAGTIGLFLAALLASANEGTEIILVEAGARVASTVLNSATSSTVGKPHDGVFHGRAAGLGGTSSLWGGQLAEFGTADLERPDAPWPITYDELVRFYRVVYKRLAIGEPESAAFYRQRFGGESESSDPIERFFTYWLKQPNLATFYQKLLQTSRSVKVITHLTAYGCEFDGEHAKVLLCRSTSKREIRIRAERFVFAGGTVATNRFFLSTQASHQVPWVNSRYLGRFFQDHLGGRIAEVSVLEEKRFRDFFENGWVNGVKLEAKVGFSSSLRKSLPTGAAGFFTYDSSISANLGNLKRTIRGIRSGLSFSTIGSCVTDMVTVGRSVLPIATRYMRNRRILAFYDQGLHLNIQAEQIPIESSRIFMSDTAVAADGLMPVAVDWRCDGRELTAVRALAVASDSYLRSRGIARLVIDPGLERGDPAFIDRLGDTYHPCGGLRMSSSQATGVVDGECKVWGTSNVWIASAAVFPSSSHANCTLTALALAARLALRLQ